MKYNLIFGGIKSEGAIENTENVVKKFLVDELLIPEAEVSEFKLLLSIPPFTKPMDILELKL
jgi:hypothetical protein